MRLPLVPVVFLLACLPAGQPSADTSSVTIEGFLVLAVGDPAAGEGAARYQAEVVDAAGRHHRVRPDSTTAIDLGTLTRFSGARVRVTGHRAREDSLLLWITRIDSLPEGRPR
jgi:hypothetical protein